MNIIRNFSGIIGSFIFVTAVLISNTIAPEVISYDEYVLSEYGVTPKTFVIFNGGIIITGIFVGILIHQLKVKLECTLPGLLWYTPAVAFVLVGIINLDISVELHWLSVVLFVFSWIALMFKISFVISSSSTAKFLQFTSLSGLVIVTIVYSLRGEYLIWSELLLAAMIFIHILVLTDILLFHKIDSPSLFQKLVRVFKKN